MSEAFLKSFLHESVLVGNKNFIVNSDDLSEILNESSAPYINVPSLGVENLEGYENKSISEAFIEASYGISETGTLVIPSLEEHLRLASSLANILNIVISCSNIKESMSEVIDQMEEWTKNNNYIAFITGASRTADIERVLTVGVHGPVELNVYIVTDK